MCALITQCFHGKPVINTIYLDYDDVLVDFFVAALDKLGYGGISPSVIKCLEQRRVWSMPEMLDIDTARFWEELEASGEEFWESLPTLPWGRSLYAYLLEGIHAESKIPMKHRVTILSTPHPPIGCYVGKIRSIRKFLRESESRDFILTTDKWRLARPDTLLIDDSEENCLKFREAGGHAILFPHHTNSLYHLRDPQLGSTQICMNIMDYIKLQMAGFAVPSMVAEG